MPASAEPNFRRSRPLILALLVLQACSTLRSPEEASEGEGVPAESAAVSFKLDVVSEDRDMARYLERYMDIQRFADFPDLQRAELRRLLDEAESNARDLLAARGYFNPALALEAGEAGGNANGRRNIVVRVDPGERALIDGHEVTFGQPMGASPEGAAQRDAIRRDWLLKDGEAFTQEAWDAAKTAGLRVLQRERYPTAHIASSSARVDADTNRVDLHVGYDAGPVYRFGALRLEGVERYDAEGIRNIARLPFGEVYREDRLLDSQQRLVASGYFDSVFLLLDNSETRPDEATVIAQLREAKLQKMVFGLGYSTDTGARASIDHTHNRMWPFGWQALNRVTAGLETQSLSTNWTAMPAPSGWAWNTGLALERSDVGDIKSNSLSLTGGRNYSGYQAEQRYYLQYDASNAEGGDAPANSSSLLGNYSWTGRFFDDRVSPTSGYGVGIDAGAGMTVTPRGKPFLRLNARAVKLWPIGQGNRAGKRGRIALRGEAGTIVADGGVVVPARLLFLTGGDTTVRGYSYQSIGTRLDDGSIYGARNMAMASLTWLNPVTLFGDARSFEHVLFADAGAAADRIRDATVYPGVGTGLRWASPMGPLEFDVAYGTRTSKWRLHLRVGFQFQ